jgi:UDP-N-acetylglucosamine 3-dehydrogenase
VDPIGGAGIFFGQQKMNMNRIKIGVVGLGWFGEKHCEVLAGLPQAELFAVCTRSETRLAEVADRFGVPHRFTDYRQMLALPELDVVSVVTMWDQHAEPTIAALQAGKHVFCEKPLAATVADCDRIVAAAEQARGSLLVGHICRFNPRYAAAKEEIAAGRIGRIVSVYARRNLPRWITAGVLDKIGPIAGDGVHDVDLMLWYTQARVVSAYAQTTRVRDLKHPDIGVAMYRFDSGAIGVCENVWALPERSPMQIDERMEIRGTEGSISIHDTTPNLLVVDKDAARYMDTTYWPSIHGQRGGALRDEWTYFLRCIQAGRRPDVIRPEESRAAVAACLAAEQSALTGQVVPL